MAKGKGSIVGAWAFLIGVVLAAILGFLGEINETMSMILVVVGLVVGLLNIGDEEVSPFLMSGAVLVIVGAFGGNAIAATLPKIGSVLGALMMIFVPATIIVAIKNVFGLAHR